MEACASIIDLSCQLLKLKVAQDCGEDLMSPVAHITINIPKIALLKLCQKVEKEDIKEEQELFEGHPKFYQVYFHHFQIMQKCTV
jgi:hypothetical protein